MKASVFASGLVSTSVLLLIGCAGQTAVPPPPAPVVSSSSVPSSSASSVTSSAPATTAIHLRGPGGRSVTVQAELARTDAERSTGLMHRTHLDADAGMLFVFDEPQELSFWMKNTLIPLDIAFFDAAGTFVSATSMEPCRADPCPSYPSYGAATYALEVNEGFLKKHGVREGWMMIHE